MLGVQQATASVSKSVFSVPTKLGWQVLGTVQPRSQARSAWLPAQVSTS